MTDTPTIPTPPPMKLGLFIGNPAGSGEPYELVEGSLTDCTLEQREDGLYLTNEVVLKLVEGASHVALCSPAGEALFCWPLPVGAAALHRTVTLQTQLPIIQMKVQGL